MKQIVAVVKALEGEDAMEINIREVKGFGRQKNYLEEYGQSEYALAFLPKVEILVWVSDENADRIVDKLIQSSRTGRIGDGKILVLPVIGTADEFIEF